jgi:hypothetical protein
MTLVSCNSTVIVAQTPPGAGSAGTVTMTVGTRVGNIASAAAITFAYAPPTVSALVSAFRVS